MSRPQARTAPMALGGVAGRARVRAAAEDFQVTERLAIAPDGDGEHLWLAARKRDCNTGWVAGQLARHYGVPRRDVSYAGRKDRHAVAEQVFTVRLPGRGLPSPPVLDGVQWLRCTRHGRKLATGALTGNAFVLRLRELQADAGALRERLAAVAARGVPNWFGPQRFGRAQANLDRAWAMLVDGRRVRDRDSAAMAISAARSWAFNRVLAERVRRGVWDALMPGELAMLAGSRSVFAVEAPDEALAARAAAFDVHPSGPMPGRAGNVAVTGDCAELERAALAELAPLVDALGRAGVRADRRALRLVPAAFDWALDGEVLELRFELPAGSFATAVLHELLECESPAGVEAIPC